MMQAIAQFRTVTATTTSQESTPALPAPPAPPAPPGRATGSAKAVHACSECGKVFKRKEHRVRHERSHRKGKPFLCSLCGRRFARRELISRHQNAFHPFALEEVRQEDLIEASSRSGLTTQTLAEVSKPRKDINDMRTPPIDANAPASANSGVQIDQSQAPTCTDLERQVSSQPANTLEVSRQHDSLSLAGTKLMTCSDFSIGDPLADIEINNCLIPPQSVRVDIDTQQIFDINSSAHNSSYPRSLSGSCSSETYNSTNGTNATPEETYIESIRHDRARASSREFGHLRDSDFELQHEDMTSNAQTFVPTNTAVNLSVGDVDFFSTLTYTTANPETQSYIRDCPFEPGQDSAAMATLFENQCDTNKTAGTSPLSQVSPSASTATTSPTDSSGKTSARLPDLANHHPKKLPIITVDKASYNGLLQDVRSRLVPEQQHCFQIPSARKLEIYLTKYLSGFHRHFPLIFVPHLIIPGTPSPFLLSMCSIGALYQLERKTAKHLWYWAGVMVDRQPTSPTNLQVESIAYLQCKLMLAIFAVFSGDMTEEAISKVGFWITEYRLRRTTLMSNRPRRESLTWETWRFREASKRLLFGIYFMSSLMTITYDIPPICSVTQDIEVEMPDQDDLWEAATAQQWQELMNQRTHNPITVRSAMRQLLFGREDVEYRSDHYKWSAYATCVVMHAVNIHMWNIMQSTQSFNIFAVDGYTNTQLKLPMIAQVEAGLGRCHSLLTKDSTKDERFADDAEGPLLFNCLAILRSAYVRVFTGAGTFDRIILLSSDKNNVTAAIHSFIADVQERSPFMTNAVSKASGGFIKPIKAGYLLYRKTAALDWGVEHAVSAWDCALFVTKWIHSMETWQRKNPPNDDEMQNLDNFRQLLSETDSDYFGKGSLAAEVTKIWACFFDDTWVWGITPRMGHVLRRLSSIYSEEWYATFPTGNPEGPISC